MAWDRSKPANNEKLRNAPSVMRDNWDAVTMGDDVGTASMLQQYSINLCDRAANMQSGTIPAVPGSADPTAQSDTFYLYSKKDGGGDPELFGEDGAGNVIQLTDGGNLGGASAITVTGIDTANATITNTQNAFCSAWVHVDLNAGTPAITSQYNVTSVTKISGGNYEITMNTALNSASYCPIATTSTNNGGNSGRAVDILDTFAFTTTKFRVIVRDRGGAPSTKDDCELYIAVFGGQV